MSVTESENGIIELYNEGKWSEIMDCYTKNSFLPWIWPNRTDLSFIGESVRRANGKVIVSVGCGSGLLEWLISKSTGIDVLGIELDRSWWTSRYAKKIFIPIRFVDDARGCHEAARSADAVLLFCYFNNEKAFVRYIDSFDGNCFIVIGPGPKKSTYTVPEPFSLPLVMESRWRMTGSREIGESEDYIAVYCRANENGSSLVIP